MIAYFAVWLATLVLLAINMALAMSSLGAFTGYINILIAGLMAGMIIWFSMDVREMRPLVRLFALGAVFWLVIMFGLTLQDYMTRSFHDTAAPSAPPGLQGS